MKFNVLKIENMSDTRVRRGEAEKSIHFQQYDENAHHPFGVSKVAALVAAAAESRDVE